jgi:hypothetical protein
MMLWQLWKETNTTLDRNQGQHGTWLIDVCIFSSYKHVCTFQNRSSASIPYFWDIIFIRLYNTLQHFYRSVSYHYMVYEEWQYTLSPLKCKRDLKYKLACRNESPELNVYTKINKVICSCSPNGYNYGPVWFRLLKFSPCHIGCWPGLIMRFLDTN